jgi:hypothetical protein
VNAGEELSQFHDRFNSLLVPSLLANCVTSGDEFFLSFLSLADKMSLYEQFLNLVRAEGGLSGAGAGASTTSRNSDHESSSRRPRAHDVIDLDDDEPLFKPRSHSMQRMEGRIPERYAYKFHP